MITHYYLLHTVLIFNLLSAVAGTAVVKQCSYTCKVFRKSAERCVCLYACSVGGGQLVKQVLVGAMLEF